MDFLLRLLSANPPADHAARMEQACQVVNWEAAIELAGRHGVAQLMTQALLATCPAAVPGAAQAELMEAYRARRGRNLYLTGELLRVLDRFEKGGIAAIPFKGPVLAMSIYGDPAARDFSDLDLLVRPGDLRSAERILMEDGYIPRFTLPAPEYDRYLRSECEQAFLRQKDQMLVELHWRFAPRCFDHGMNIARVWDRAETAVLGGRNVRSLSAEDALLMVCLHGAKHLWQELKWICDVAGLCGRPDLDWHLIQAQAREYDLERTVASAIYLAQRALGVTLSKESWAHLAEDTMLARSAEALYGYMLRSTAPGLLERVRFHVARRRCLSDKMRQLWLVMTAPTESDWRLVALPRRMNFLYAILRPLRLIRKRILREEEFANAGNRSQERGVRRQ
jgi:hypothetical protein